MCRQQQECWCCQLWGTRSVSAVLLHGAWDSGCAAQALWDQAEGWRRKAASSKCLLSKYLLEVLYEKSAFL